MERFPLARSRAALPLILPLAPRRPEARIGDGRLELRMGWLGRADVPLGRIAAIGTMRWPWWAGVGVRIARGTVAFVATSGVCAVIELTGPVSVRAPLPWRTTRLVVRPEDLGAFIAALTRARRALEDEEG